MNASSHEALDLCRGLLAFSAPGTAVAVPHAALAQLVELAAGVVSSPATDAPVTEPLQKLFDVAALAKRYNRAPQTVRQWFHDGLFGPPEERRFRGRGYVASVEAVHDFEERTGLTAVGSAEPGERRRSEPSAQSKTVREIRPARARTSQSITGSGFGGKIFAAQGGRARRTA